MTTTSTGRRENEALLRRHIFFIALLSADDQSHAHAKVLAAELRRTYTSGLVLTELADAMAAPGRRERFLPFQFLRASGQVTIVPFDQALFDRGVALYDQRPDKAWSVTDCISFVIMQDHGLHDALTADHHFEQAGFNALMK